MTPLRAGTRLSSIFGLTLLVATMAATGCASGDAERARRAAAAELAELSGQVGELKKSQETSVRERTRLTEQLKALDAQQAFLVAEAKALRDDLSQAQKALGQNEALVRELKAALEEVEKKAAAPPTAPPGGTGRPASAVPRDVSPDKLYAAGMASFRAEEHGQAVLEFSELVDRFPQHSLASTSQYWIGEAYYRQRDFRQALAEFQKVVDGYPQSAQVPEALLKLGLCQRALKDSAAARESWERVVKGYPNTNAANQARALLPQLGAPARGAR